MTTDTGKPDEPGRTHVYKLYYTFCDECGAIDDYADTRREAEKNRRRHDAEHRAFESGETDVHPSRRPVR